MAKDTGWCLEWLVADVATVLSYAGKLGLNGNGVAAAYAFRHVSAHALKGAQHLGLVNFQAVNASA